MKIALTIALAAFLFISCADEKKPKELPTAAATDFKLEDFNTFLEKFGADSVFQKSRIKFPLISEIHDTDTEKPTLSTTAADKWEFFNIKELKKDRKYIVKTEKKREQYIVNVQLTDTGVYIDYVFKLLGNKWTLIRVVDQST